MAENSGGGMSVGQVVFLILVVVVILAVAKGGFSLNISSGSLSVAGSGATRQQLDRNAYTAFGPVSPGVNRSFAVTPYADQAPRSGCQLAQSSSDTFWTYRRWHCPR